MYVFFNDVISVLLKNQNKLEKKVIVPDLSMNFSECPAVESFELPQTKKCLNISKTHGRRYLNH